MRICRVYVYLSHSKSKVILFDSWVIPGKIRRFQRPRFITQPDFRVYLSLRPDSIKDLLNGRHEDEKRRRQVGPDNGHDHPGGEVGQIHGLDCGHQRGPQHEQDQGEGDTPAICDLLCRGEQGMHLFSCRPLGQVGEIELFRIPRMEANNHICVTGPFSGSHRLGFLDAWQWRTRLRCEAYTGCALIRF